MLSSIALFSNFLLFSVLACLIADADPESVRSGKALYVGISSYGPEMTKQAVDILNELGTPCLIHQPSYSMFNRWIENGLLDVLDTEGVGCIAFSPLAQGLLTSKYLGGVPEDARVNTSDAFQVTLARGPESNWRNSLRESKVHVVGYERGVVHIISSRLSSSMTAEPERHHTRLVSPPPCGPTTISARPSRAAPIPCTAWWWFPRA